MEPFSLALGVLTVVQTSYQAVQTLYDFTKTVKGAREEIQSLTREAHSLYGVLHRINEDLKDPKIAAYVAKNPALERDLAALKEPLKDLESRIEELMVKLKKNTDQGTDGQRTLNSVRWYFVKDAVNSMRNDLAYTTKSANLAFAGFNYTETIRKNAEQDVLPVPSENRSPSPLGAQLVELQKQGGALRRAARDGDVRAIELLLNAGVPVDSKNREGRTALSSAAEFGNIETVELLLKRKAFVNAASNEIKEGNWYKRAEGKRTPLHWAAVSGHILVAGKLLDAEANIESTTCNQRTPAVEAAQAQHFKTVSFLLERGADINAKTYYGWTMIHTAASTGKMDLAELLLSRGANVEAVYRGTWHGEGKGEIGATHQHPLHYATRPSRRPNPDETAMIELLIAKGGAKLSAQDSEGATPVHYVVRTKWEAALKVLLRHATVADLATKDASGDTAFDHATKLGNDVILDLMKATQDMKPSPNRSLLRQEETYP